MKPDCLRLRIQIQSLVGVAVLGLGACDHKREESAPQPLAPVPQPKVDSVKTASPAVAVPSVANQPILPGYLLGDPPYVEGWDPEEATCVSGNWCGLAQAAMEVVRIGMEDDLDPETQCPKRLMGKKKGGVDAKDPRFKGLSSQWEMRGTFQPWRTQKARQGKPEADLCCYHWFNYCAGRPLDDGTRTQAGRALVVDQSSLGSACDEAAMATARAFWADGDDEYDSVAAFARCTLELFALGAPAQLIAASQQASLDELEHARMCRELSNRYHRHDWPTREGARVEARKPELVRLLIDSLREGCIGESIASLRARRMAELATDAAAREILLRIAEDEARHAALAWKIFAWGYGRADAAQRRRVHACIHSLEQELQASLPAKGEAPMSIPGRLSAKQLRDCTLDAWQEIVRPMLAGFINGSDRDDPTVSLA